MRILKQKKRKMFKFYIGKITYYPAIGWYEFILGVYDIDKQLMEGSAIKWNWCINFEFWLPFY